MGRRRFELIYVLAIILTDCMLCCGCGAGPVPGAQSGETSLEEPSENILTDAERQEENAEEARFGERGEGGFSRGTGSWGE